MAIKLRRVFFDTGAYVALLDRSDRYHVPAVECFQSLSADRIEQWTTSLVVGETYTWIRYRIGYDMAIRWLDTMDRAEVTGDTRLVYPDRSVDQEARGILRRFSDQDLSFVDAVTLVSVRSPVVADAIFAFDHHLTLAGLPVVPGPMG